MVEGKAEIPIEWTSDSVTQTGFKYSCAPECPHCGKTSVQPFTKGEIFCPVCLATFDLETLFPGIFEIVMLTKKGALGLYVW